MTDELRFDGRVAVVTGAGGGLGASHARLLAARGCAVVVNDIDEDGATGVVDEITANGGRACRVPADAATEDGARLVVATAVDQFGRIDIVVNNAGLLRPTDFVDMTADVWDRLVAVNLRATFLVAHAAWPHLSAQHYGRIVSTTSNSGLLGVAGSSAYSAAKAAVWGLTRSLALEGVTLGIAVNAVAPIAYTAMSAESRLAPEAWRTGEGDAWSRRLATASVSSVVGWLAHERCTLNGQILSAAGGRVARFMMSVTEGFDRDDLTVEDVGEHETFLVNQTTGIEYRAAAHEGRDLHSRLLGPGRT